MNLHLKKGGYTINQKAMGKSKQLKRIRRAAYYIPAEVTGEKTETRVISGKHMRTAGITKLQSGQHVVEDMTYAMKRTVKTTEDHYQKMKKEYKRNGVAGVRQTAILGAANPDVGAQYLLPVFAAGFLGATAIRPGRFNVGGTVLALLLLAVGIAGLTQLGAPLWVSPVFNGLALIIAVALAVRRRDALAES